MDTAISMQRPRPQNLALCLGSDLSDFRPFTALIKQPSNGWSASCRSATLKNGSLAENEYQASINRAELEQELRTQMAYLKSKNAFLQTKPGQDCQRNPDEAYKNFSTHSNSETQNSGTVSLSPCSIRGKTLEDEQFIKEKAMVIERLESDLRRVTEEKILESVEKIKLTEERDLLKANLVQKNTLLELIMAEKDKIKTEMEVEMVNKIKEVTDLKNEYTTCKAKHDQLHRELMVSKIITEEKHKKIVTLEKEIASLVKEQENSQKICKEMHEAKVLINEFNEKLEISAQSELFAALQLLLEECKKSQQALKEEMNSKKEISEKMRLMEEKTLNDVASLEKEKEGLNLKLSEVHSELERAKAEFNSKKEELSQVILQLETDRTNLTVKLQESESQAKASLKTIEAKEAELNDIRKNVDKEKSLLQDELKHHKIESISSLNEIKDKNTSLQGTIMSLDEERLKLQEKLNEYTDKLQTSLKEIAELQAKSLISVETEGKLKQEKEELQKLLEESQVNSQSQIAQLQEIMMNKNLHIEALIADVNQMKEFIVEYHGESVFEDDSVEETAEEAVQQVVEEPEQEVEEVEEEQQVIEVIEEKEEVIQEQTVEPPSTQPSSHRSFQEPTQIEESYERKSYINQPWKDELIIYKPKTSTTQSIDDRDDHSSRRDLDESRDEKYETPRKGAKWDPMKERKQRDEEITQKQLEKMILDLNDKLTNSEKKAKKMVEEKLQEAARSYQEKEDNLLAEMEKIQDEKKALLKKIDDMQWEQAIQYTQKLKADKQEEEKALEAANKQKQQALEASKKKKKK